MSLVNAMVSAASEDERWVASIGVTNLTDEDYLTSGTSSFIAAAGYVEHVWAREREYNLKLIYSW